MFRGQNSHKTPLGDFPLDIHSTRLVFLYRFDFLHNVLRVLEVSLQSNFLQSEEGSSFDIGPVRGGAKDFLRHFHGFSCTTP